MDHHQIIFFRNLMLRCFVVGVVFALLIFAVTAAFWDAMAPMANRFFKVDEKELGRLVLQFFLNMRLVLTCLFLAPAIALHWTSKK